MYQVRPTSEDRWAVVDLNAQIVFEGTRRECEDWLDRQENLPRKTESLEPQKPASLFARIRKWFQSPRPPAEKQTDRSAEKLD